MTQEEKPKSRITAKHLAYFIPSLMVSLTIGSMLACIIKEGVTVFFTVMILVICGAMIEHARLLRVGDIE